MSNLISSNIKLNKKQNEAWSYMTQGRNVFITGAGGTGKTSCIKLFFRTYRSLRKISMTSTTGTSALLFGGTTLHSYLGIGLGKGSEASMISKINSRSYMKKRWRELEVLVVDEISMLSPELFDKLNKVAKVVRMSKEPFGGIQLILSGDFCQLPCINSDGFCFQAKTWEECVEKTVYLTEIIRQSDFEFQKCLNNVRVGNFDNDTIKLLQSRVGINLENSIGIRPTRLYSTNYSVDKINDKELDKLAENGAEFMEYEMEMVFTSQVKNKQRLKEICRKNCQAVQNLQICKNTQVMLLHNLDLENNLANGSRGVVTGFVDDLPRVKFLTGEERVIDYHVWEIEENNVNVVSITQIPLKIAYAITIHKSQGVSLDYVTMNLKNVFTFGQAYVALSRVKNLKGLSIIDIDFTKIVAHPLAVKYYESLQHTKNNIENPPT